jgi:anti-anti-sigma factor
LRRQPLVRENKASSADSGCVSENEKMALQITDHTVEGVSVLSLDGKVVLGDESAALRARVKSLLDADKRKLVLNLSKVTFVDSSGLGTLVALHHSARACSGSLRWCELGPKLRMMLEMTKLIAVLDVRGTEAEAISSFGI